MPDDHRSFFNGRPESTIAQNFAADLDSMFGLDPRVEELTQTVEAKKATVSSGEQQLQELEARLRETEQRLARVSRQSSPSRTTVPRTQATEGGAVTTAAKQPSPLASKPTFPDSRPPTQDAHRPQAPRENTQTLMAGMPGAMPPEPSAATYSNSSSEYVMVDRNAGQAAQRGYG